MRLMADCPAAERLALESARKIRNRRIHNPFVGARARYVESEDAAFYGVMAIAELIYKNYRRGENTEHTPELDRNAYRRLWVELKRTEPLFALAASLEIPRDDIENRGAFLETRIRYWMAKDMLAIQNGISQPPDSVPWLCRLKREIHGAVRGISMTDDVRTVHAFLWDRLPLDSIEKCGKNPHFGG
ncbi:hypothetical protein BT63DRAFT_409009 [Microthyrium microscopicum]|uniref:Uncharacterized protein n=1 Tax=Microthyrium microscopicum TaxID=703497 RepID=A0A6A6UTW9_9PEZI|nr:hypothetical protein BT63DRAFT_409009 [Microthyrium microscopicum]